MSPCCSGESCEVPRSRASGEAACPRCGEVGRVVADETIQAILKPGQADGLLTVERRFCKTPGCAVLYYGADGRFVEKGAASVRIGVKETDDPVPLCYCFGFTREDVRRQLAERGDSDIPARITAEVRAGRCSCEVKNPSGTCCLGDVNKAVKEAKEALLQARGAPAARRGSAGSP
jgi:CopZ-like zinc binding protein